MRSNSTNGNNIQKIDLNVNMSRIDASIFHLKKSYDEIDRINLPVEVKDSSSDMSETSINKKYNKFEIIKNGKWSDDEDEQLRKLVKSHGLKNWKRIAEELPTRTAVQCLHRWTKILQPGLVKGPWTIEEDSQLIEWVKKEGPHKWSHCSEIIKGRSGKQCRERWFNTLNPNVVKGNWSAEEDYLIFKLFSEYGSKWSKIASHFEGRTENSIKNRFYSTLRRIHAEKKKSESDHKHSGNTYNSTSREELLQYFSEALAEKSVAYEKSKKPNDRMLNRKCIRNKINQETNIIKESLADTFSFSPVRQNLDLMTIKDEKLEFPIDELNLNFSQNFSNQNVSANCSDFMKTSTNANNSMSQILSLFNKLNHISTFLTNTKGELIKFDTMKNTFLSIANNNNFNMN